MYKPHIVNPTESGIDKLIALKITLIMSSISLAQTHLYWPFWSVVWVMTPSMSAVGVMVTKTPSSGGVT